jgi:hypothetical protein
MVKNSMTLIKPNKKEIIKVHSKQLAKVGPLGGKLMLKQPCTQHYGPRQ